MQHSGTYPMGDVAKIDVNPTKTNAATRRRQQIEIGFSPEQRHQDSRVLALLELLPRRFSFSSICVGPGPIIPALVLSHDALYYKGLDNSN